MSQTDLCCAREDPLDWDIFKEKSFKAGIPPSTFYTRVKQLQKYGILEHIDIVKLTDRHREANSRDIADIIRAISERSNVVIKKDRLNQLRLVSARYRICHIPGVVNALETFINDPWIISDFKTTENLMEILCTVLHLEREYPCPDSDLYVQELTGVIFLEIISL